MSKLNQFACSGRGGAVGVGSVGVVTVVGIGLKLPIRSVIITNSVSVSVDASFTFASIVAHAGGLPNVLRPLELDAAAATWPVEGPEQPGSWDAVVACNVCHISPFPVTEGLLGGAGRVLVKGSGMLFIYGPFMVDGKHTAPSNEAFDARLRSQNPAWGVRDATELVTLAKAHGLELVAREEMPANNFILCFEKRN